MFYDKISGFSDEISEDITTQFEVLKKLNIHYFEPRGINGKNISELSDTDVYALREEMKKYGISASSIGSPIGKIKLSDDWDKHFSLFQRVVEIAKMLDTQYIRIFSFYHEEGEWTATERTEVLTRLKKMISYAKEQDVVLLHENEKEIYGDTAQRCLDLMQELGCDHFQAVFDPANFVQCKQNALEAYDILKNHIVYMHIKDACMDDGHVVPSGQGDGNVENILKNLFTCGYQGYLSLEPHLGSFTGFTKLEKNGKLQELPEGGEGTFTLAYMALENILEDIQKR
ncbi:MAG: sugar phosphate isomerase/epimerase family protein [Oliverpabstia sp.]